MYLFIITKINILIEGMINHGKIFLYICICHTSHVVSIIGLINLKKNDFELTKPLSPTNIMDP